MILKKYFLTSPSRTWKRTSWRLLKARRPDDYQAKDLTDLAVFSIITKSRVRNVPPNQIRRFNFMYRLRLPVIKVGEKIASVFTP